MPCSCHALLAALEELVAQIEDTLEDSDETNLGHYYAIKPALDHAKTLIASALR